MEKFVGILGGGNISESHVKAAQEARGVRIAAVCGYNSAKVAKLAKSAGVPAYTDLGDFLSHKPMDLVAIGSPSGTHAEQGVQAAEKGLHVLVEKPIDITTERADRLIETCSRMGVKLGVFFQDRVAPDLLRLKSMIDDGDLGRIHLATAHVKWFRPPEYYGDSQWRGTWALDGGGAVMNQGSHTVDLLLWLLGEPRRVYGATGTKVHTIETEDTAVAVIEFRSGALATFEAATSAYPGQPRRLFVSGSEGTAQVEHDLLVSVDLVNSTVSTQKKREPDRNLSESSPVVENVTGHRLIIEDFVRAIEQDINPLCDGVEGRRSVELIEAIYKSAGTKQPIELGTGS